MDFLAVPEDSKTDQIPESGDGACPVACLTGAWRNWRLPIPAIDLLAAQNEGRRPHENSPQPVYCSRGNKGDGKRLWPKRGRTAVKEVEPERPSERRHTPLATGRARKRWQGPFGPRLFEVASLGGMVDHVRWVGVDGQYGAKGHQNHKY